MKCSTCAVIACALAVTMARPAAQRVTLSTDLIKDWRAQQETMMRLADAMPESTFGFKPTPPQRSYGEQILHVAGANIMLMKFLGGKTSAPPITDKDLSTFGLKATSKADILQALKQSYEFGDAVLQRVLGRGARADDQGPAVDWRGDAGEDGVLHDGTHAGHLRPDGGVPAAQRHRASGESTRRGVTGLRRHGTRACRRSLLWIGMRRCVSAFAAVASISFAPRRRRPADTQSG